jgi:hypothetical protein
MGIGFIHGEVLGLLWILEMDLELGLKIMARGKRFVMWLIKDDEKIFDRLLERFHPMTKADIVRQALRILLEGTDGKA